MLKQLISTRNLESRKMAVGGYLLLLKKFKVIEIFLQQLVIALFLGVSFGDRIEGIRFQSAGHSDTISGDLHAE